METIANGFKFFLQFYFAPRRAVSGIIDNGGFIFAAIAVLVVSFIFQAGVNSRLQAAYTAPRFDFELYRQPNAWRNVLNANALDAEEREEIEVSAAYQNYQRVLRERRQLPVVGDAGLWLVSFQTGNFFSVLLALAVFYVPTLILLITLFEPIGSFSVVFRRDYGVLATCTLMAWAAAHLPFAVIGFVLRGNPAVDAVVFLGLWAAGVLLFGALMVIVLQTVFGASYRGAFLTVGLAWLGILLGNRVFSFISPFLFSPFLLFYAYAYLRGEAGTMSNAFRGRQNFRRFLNNAALNPHDAEARVQLGLIHKQRRQLDEAERYFNEALKIDASEIDANYEAGKIARDKGELEKALKHFAVVAEQNDKYAASEIWREIGATYLAAGALDDARQFLEKFVERRAFDAEGLYLLGETLQRLNLTSEAGEMFRRCVEAVQTSPDYRRGANRKWGQLASKQIR